MVKEVQQAVVDEEEALPMEASLFQVLSTKAVEAIQAKQSSTEEHLEKDWAKDTAVVVLELGEVVRVAATAEQAATLAVVLCKCSSCTVSTLRLQQTFWEHYFLRGRTLKHQSTKSRVLRS